MVTCREAAHRIRRVFAVNAATIDYIINDTFKDNLQKINNMIQLAKKFFKKNISCVAAIAYHFMCSVPIE